MEFGNGFCTSEMLFNISVPEEPIIPDEYYAFCEFPANPDLDPTLDLFFNGLPVNQTELNSEGTYTYSVNNDCYDVSGNFEVELLTVEPISIDAVLCEGESFVLSLGDFNVYSIDNPENEELIFQPDNSTEFQLSLLDLASDCPVSLTLSIDVINEPQWSLPPDTMLCEGTSLSITWPQSFDLIVNDSLYNNSIGLTEPAQLYFVSENECFSIEHWMQLEFEECSEEICDLYFPNAITTNDDLRNDLFYGKTACEWNNFQLQIYNRWGEKIFQTDDINHKWPENDEDIPIGVYVWQVRCSLNESIEPLLLKGHVTVIE
jgi:gliding motility-associated-like protein